MGTAYAGTVTVCICIIHSTSAGLLIGPVGGSQKPLDEREQRPQLSQETQQCRDWNNFFYACMGHLWQSDFSKSRDSLNSSWESRGIAKSLVYRNMFGNHAIWICLKSSCTNWTLMSGFVNRQLMSICADMHPCVGVCVCVFAIANKLKRFFSAHTFISADWRHMCAAGNIGREDCVFLFFGHDGRPCCVRTSQTFPQSQSLCSAAWGMCVTETGRAGVHKPDLDLFYYLPSVFNIC